MSSLYRTSSVHTHTTWCDGKNTPAEMAAAALDCGLRTLGFSGHIYTPADTSYCMSPEGTEEYRRQALELRREYAGRLDILVGVEYDPLAGLTLPEGWDYVIGSVHALQGPENGKLYPVDLSTQALAACIQDGFGGDVWGMIRAYYSQVVQVAALRPTILGHFDLIVKTNRDGCLFDESSSVYRSIALEALDACLEQGVCLEMNTGGIWRGWRQEAYPDDFLLRRIAEKEGDVTITADAHETAALAFGYTRCAQRARQAGLDRVLVLQAGGFVPCGLEDLPL